MERRTHSWDASSGGGEDLLVELSRTRPIEPFVGTDRYRVRRCLGEGGFGVVYEVEDLELGRRLALKTLRAGVGLTISHRIGRLKAEFRSVADLVHPNLVGLHELASDGDRWFFTMDLVRGADFLDYVCGDTSLAYEPTATPGDGGTAPRRRDTSGILSEPRLRASLRQLVAGVGALHEAGIVHRDLKPSNVLVEPEGRVVILDFGLAHATEAFEEMSLPGAGTPAYMAPEQALDRELTPAVDWYAIGVMLYEALTGQIPFDADSSAELVAKKLGKEPRPPSDHGDVPEDLERLCLDLLARDPEDRPDADAIAAILGHADVPAAVRSRPRDPLFVGRRSEMDVLTEALTEVRHGRPALVRVVGQPGVGKSSLLERFVEERCATAHATVLAGRCHEREAVPFKAMDGVTDAVQRYLRRLPRNEASALMPRDIHLVTRLFPALDGVPAIRDVPRRPDVELDPSEVRRRAFAALKELLARIADKEPVVVVVDDLQWGDVDSARLIASLVAPPDPPAMLLVLAYRDEDLEHNEPLRETLRTVEAARGPSPVVELGPLPAEEAEALAGQLMQGASPEAARRVAARGEGHPLFIAELSREHLFRGDEVEAPSLLDILWRRVLRISAEARALLETVALAGQPRDARLCFEAAGLDPGNVDVLRLLRAEQLVRASDRGVLNVFHDRVRDAVIARADRQTQRLRHLSIARCLERLSRPDLEALAHHFDAAGERASAATYAERAGEAARLAMAFGRAAAMFQLAIDRSTTPPAALYEKLAEAHLDAGANVAAGEAFLAAAERSVGAAAIDLTRRAAQEMLMVGDVDGGYAALDVALGAVGEKLPRSLRAARLETTLRMLRIRLGGFRERASVRTTPERQLRLDVLDTAARALEFNDMGRANAMGARFCQHALAGGDERQRALALVGAVPALFVGRRRRPEMIDDVLDRVDDRASQLEDPTVLAHSLVMRAKSLLAFGDWPSAVAMFERAAMHIENECTGMANQRRTCLGLAAACHIRLANFERAQHIAEVGLLDARERRDPVIEKGVCGAIFAPLALVADRLDEAEGHLSFAAMEDRCTMVLIKTEVRAALMNYRERPDAAVVAWRERWDRIEAYGLMNVPVFRVNAFRSRIVAMLSGDRWQKDWRRARRLWRSIRGYRFALALAAAATAGTCFELRRGRLDEARAQLTQAIDGYETCGLHLEADACRYRLAELDGTAVDAPREAILSAGVAVPERWVRTVLPPLIELTVEARRRRGLLAAPVR